MPVGGGSNKLFYRVKQTDHSVFIPADTANTLTAEAGATPISSPAYSSVAFHLKDDSAKKIIVESSGFKYDDNGIGTQTYSHTNAEQEFFDFIDIAAPKKSGSSSSVPEELESETGTKIGGASGAAGAVYLCIDQGGENSDGDILTSMSIVTVKKSSGGRDYKAKGFVKPSFEVTQVACNKASGFAIPQAVFKTSIWGTIDAADRTIAEDYYEKTAYLPAA